MGRRARRALRAPARLAGRARAAWGGAPHVLAVMALVDATGSGLFLAASIAVFTRLIRVSGEQIGLGLTVAGVISLLAAVPTGLLMDRFGPRTMLAAVSLWRAAGLLAYCWCRTFTQFLLVTCVLALADRAAPPITQALVALVAGPERRVRVMATLRSVRNVGFTLGALLAGVVLGLDSRPAYLAVLAADALSFVAVVFLVRALWLGPPDGAGADGGRPDGGRPDGAGADGGHPDGGHPDGGRRTSRGGRLLVLRDRRFLRATAVNAVLSLHLTLLAVAIPTWVLERTTLPRVVLAPALALNTVLTVAFQVPASRGTDSVSGSARALYRAGVASGVCCLLLAGIPVLPVGVGTGLLVLAMLALTAAELWQSAGGWGLSYALSPPEHRGVYLSTFNIGVTAQQVFGPGLVAVCVIPLGPPGWIGLGAVVFLMTAVAPAALRRRSAPAARGAPGPVARPTEPGWAEPG
ncbi:MAG TPA: MFS transporter [Kineosporiaceae bacterium]